MDSGSLKSLHHMTSCIVSICRCVSIINDLIKLYLWLSYQSFPSVHLVHPKHCLDACLKITELHTITLAPPKRNFATSLASHFPNPEDSSTNPTGFWQVSRSLLDPKLTASLCLWITTLGSIDSAGTLADSQETGRKEKLEKLASQALKTSDMPKSLKSWHELSLSQSCTIFVTLEKPHIGMKWDEDEWRVYSRFEVKDALRIFKMLQVYNVGILHAVAAEGTTASFASYLSRVE